MSTTSISSTSSDSESEIQVTCNYCPKHADPQSDRLPIECILSNGAPCQACARQLELKIQIEETKKLLDKLIAEEVQARLEINQFHDPFHRLPVEITSHIFGFTLPKISDQEKEERWEKTRSETGVLTLGAVCQLWRNIAWSTTQLWSRVRLRITEEPTRNMVDVVEGWLKRSGDLPLSIRLDVGRYCFGRDDDGDIVDDGDSVYKSHETFAFIDLINDCSARWQNLSLKCDDDVLELFDAGNSEPNRLKTLQLFIVYNTNRHEPVFRPYCRATPQLKHIIVRGIGQLRNIDISWNNATNVTVGRLPVADCIRLLQITPKLINLRLEGIQEGRSRHSNQTPKSFPRLRTMYVSVKSSFAAILDSITLPSLDELHINGIYKEDRRSSPLRLPSNCIVEFLGRSSCSLNSFTLEYSECEEQEIIHIINSLPYSLKNLHLDIQIPQSKERDHNLPVLFNHLSRNPSATSGVPSQSPLLPNLETFKYHVFETTQIPWEPLLRIPRPVSGGMRPFKKLTIIQRIQVNSRKLDVRDNTQLPFMITKSRNVDKSILRELIKLQQDGIDLYLPHEVPHQYLLDLLHWQDK